DRQPRAEADTVDGDRTHVDLRQLMHPLGQMVDPRLDELLPVERRMILRVLAQIAELDRLLDRFRKRDVELVTEALEFLGNLGLDLFQHSTLPHGCASPSVVARATTDGD